jgi:hypothetical protein
MLLPRPQKATAFVVDECAYSRDVVPLSPAVREANRRNQVVPRACPPGNVAGLPVGLHNKIKSLQTPFILTAGFGVRSEKQYKQRRWENGKEDNNDLLERREILAWKAT